MSLSYLIIPLIAVLIAQMSKFFIPKNRLHMSWKNMTAYSGMPSSHAALTISLATTIGLRVGFSSPVFAVALLLAIISLRDAIGIRQYIGKQGKVLNELVEDLNDEDYLSDSYPRLLEKVGHTPAQLLIGSLIGVAVACVGYFILGTGA